jgi:hypothetical protein
MAKLRATLDKVKLGAAGVLGPISAAAPVLQAFGGAALLASTINLSAYVPSMTAAAASTWALLSPILLIGGAIAAAAGAGLLIAKVFGDDIRAAFDSVKKAGANTVAWLKKLPSKVMGGLKKFGSLAVGAFNSVVDAVTSLPSKAMSALGDFKQAIVGRISSVVGQAKSFGADFLDAIPSPSELLQRGKALVQSLADGISELASLPAEAITNVAEAVRRRLPFSPAEVGPLSDLDESGEALPETMAEGMESNTPRMAEAAAEVASSAELSSAPTFSSAGGSLSPAAIREAFEGLGLELVGGTLKIDGDVATLEDVDMKLRSLNRGKVNKQRRRGVRR